MSRPSPSPVLLEDPNSNKQWTCNQCKHSFSQSRLLETHAADTDHKAYRCTKEKDCGKSFILRPSWVRHEGSHSGQKPQAYSRCQKKFRRKDNCHDHERTCGRVARRAGGLSQLASTPPTTSETTADVTPIGLFTNVADGRNQCHTASNRREGLLSFDTSVVPHQIDNGNEDEQAVPSLSRRLSESSKPSATATIACFSTTNMAPTPSRSAALHDSTAVYLSEADHNTDNPLTSFTNTSQSSFTSQSPLDIDWTHLHQWVQNQGAAWPSQDLTGFWNDAYMGPAACELDAEPSGSGNIVSNAALSSGLADIENARQLMGHVDYNVCSNIASFDQDKVLRVSNERPPVSVQDHASQSVTSDSVTHISLPKPESKPRSKVATFFSKLKACIRAPFRKFKQ